MGEEREMKKSIPIFLMMLLIATALSSVSGISSKFENIDISSPSIVIDQQQDESQGTHHLTGGMWYASAWQDFVPSMAKFESVEIKLQLVQPVEPGRLIVQIREGDVNGPVLHEWTMDLDIMQYTPVYHIFHYSVHGKALILEPGEKYTIYLQSPNTADVIWFFGDGDPYPDGLSSRGACCDFTFRTYAYENLPPELPVIDYVPFAFSDDSGNFRFTSDDPDGDEVSYYIDWDDGSHSGWTDFQACGSPGYCEGHSYSTQDAYTVRAKAKDKYGGESQWSDPFEVEVDWIDAMLFGIIENKIDHADSTEFDAVTLLYLHMGPLEFNFLSSGEKIFVSNDSGGFVGNSFILGNFKIQNIS